MKATDIKPGMPVMVGGDYVRWSDVKSGRSGLPAIVLAFGKYRLTQQGPCGFVAVENPKDWEKPVVVVLRQSVGRWSRREDELMPGVITPETEWVLGIVSQHQLLPVPVWQTFHDEYKLLKLDEEALQNQLFKLNKERDAVVSADPTLADAVLAVVKGRREKNEYCSITPDNWDAGTTIRFSGLVNIETLTFETSSRVAELNEQINKLQQKLSCIR